MSVPGETSEMANPYRDSDAGNATTLRRIFQGSEMNSVGQLRSGRGILGEMSWIQMTVRIRQQVSEGWGMADVTRKAQETLLLNWHAASGLSQGLAEIAALPDTTTDKAQLAEQAQQILRAMLDYKNSGITINTLVAVHSEYAVPDVLRAFAAFKPRDLDRFDQLHLEDTDVVTGDCRRAARGILL